MPSERELMLEINALARKQFGLALTHLACQHLDKACRENGSYKKTYLALWESRNESRSHFIACQMYQSLIAAIALQEGFANGEV